MCLIAVGSVTQAAVSSFPRVLWQLFSETVFVDGYGFMRPIQSNDGVLEFREKFSYRSELVISESCISVSTVIKTQETEKKFEPL